MLLRKHIQNGKIISITQPGMERILNFEIEHLDEMGDLCRKLLIVELMGKHSNIIFSSTSGVIIDSIKHISGLVSSVREVLPGKEYFIPHTQDKENPLSVTREQICYRAGGNADLSNAALDEDGRERLYHSFQEMMEDVRTGSFSPCIVYENNAPAEYAAVCLTSYPENARKDYTSISLLLEDYYAEKNTITRIRQRSSDLRRIVSTALERNVKKYDRSEQ